MDKEDLTHETGLFPEAHDANSASWDPILGVENERLVPIEELKKV